MSGTVIIPARFNGPPDSANGGYACGLVAGLVDGEAETSLRSPPPLDRPLAVVREGNAVTVIDGETLVAQAAPTTIDLEVPEPPSIEVAEAATAGWPGAEEHVFPTCFTCGPARNEGDGMRVFPGPIADGRFTASPWIPPEGLADDDGLVPEPVMWAALDCPGMAAGSMESGEVTLLGRMAARVERRATPGETYVVFGWPSGRDGRKLFSASAVVDGAGVVLAAARLTSIIPR